VDDRNSRENDASSSSITTAMQRRINPAVVLGDALPMHDAAAALAEPTTKPLFVRERLLGTP
jgi:hypothetical protein